MKTMKFFKKPALLLSIIAIAVVLTVSAIATLGFVQNGENTADLGEEYAAVQVSTSGKVSLKFYYSTTGTATGFVAEVTDPVTNEVETQNFAVADLETTANGVCVPVALAPSQMTHTVKVYAVGENGEVSKNVLNYSVAEYANEILDDANQSAYHDAMRALLNWGAMAQNKFNDATSVPANAGIFERNTNSMWGMDSFSYTEGAVVPGTTITGQTMNLSIEPNNIAIHFYVNYTGEGTLTATVYRDGGEAVATDVLKADDGLYRVRISNVPASMFDTPYTVTITDGTDTFKATKTVREYLGALLDQCNDNGDISSGNVARTMYQLYQLVTGNTGADTCAHGTTVNKLYWVSEADGTQRVRCIYCHADLAHKNLDAGVNAYAPAANLQLNTGVTGSVDRTFMTEDGVQFVRFDNYYTNREGWGDISLSSVFAGNTGVSGQYLVIKYRVGTAGNGYSNPAIQVYANTNKSSTTGLTGDGYSAFPKVNDNQWHTIVIDLASRTKTPSVAFVDEGDGTYNVRYLSLRMFQGAENITSLDDSAAGRYTYAYKDANGEWHTYYGNKPSDAEITENGYTLTKLYKQTMSADAYMDISYIALCDSMTDAKTLLDTAEYEWSVANDLSAYRNSVDDTCTRHQNAVTSVAGDTATTYTAQCKACGAVVAKQVVSNEINYFASYESMSVYAATGTITKALFEDGVIFNRYTFSGGCHANITGGGEAGSLTSSTYTTGKYVTFKYRWIDKSVDISLNVATGDKKDGNGAGNGTQAAANAPVNEWRVAVVDVSGNAEWTTGSAQQIYTMFTAGGAGTLDIAYYAVVDSYAEAALLMGENDVYMYDYGTTFADTTPILRNNKGECPHSSGVTESLTDTACSYICNDCGEAAKTITLPESVTLFYSPSNMNKATGGSSTLNENNIVEANIGKLTPNTRYQMSENAFTYDGTPHYTFKGSAGGTSQFIWMRSMQDVSSASAHERYYVDIDQARYIVIKARASADALNDAKLYFSTSGYTGSKSVAMPLSAAGAEEWGVYVIDISKVLSTYYVKNAETDTYELDCFYFHISNFSTTDRIDLAYIAFVEDWAGVDTIVEEETFYNLTDTAGAYNELNTADRTCVGEHPGYSVQVIDGVYKTACTACGYVSRDHGVKADAVNGYWPAEYLYTCATQVSTSASGYSSITGKYNQTEIVTEGGETFLRLGDAETNHAASGKWGGWFIGSSDGKNGVPGAGRYMVMKVRQNDNSVNRSYFEMYITSQEGFSSWAKGYTAVALPEDNNWHTIVIDLAERNTSYLPTAETGVYDLATFHIRPFCGIAAIDDSTDEIMDFAYIAFFDDLADLKNIIGEDTYEWSKSSTSSAIRDTETHECALHVPAETVSGTVHTIACTECGDVLRTYDVGAVNYITSLGTMNYFGNGTTYLTKNLYDAEEKVLYNHYSATASTHFNFTGGGGAGSVTGSQYNSGSYIIMKVRATGADKTTLTLYLSTDGSTNTSAGKVGALTVYAEEGWTTVILKNPVPSEGGAYALNTTANLYFMGMPGGDRELDIAYLAVADTLEDAKTLLQDGENYKLYEGTFSSMIGHFDQNGNCFKHSDPNLSAGPATRVEGDATVYYFACGACGQDTYTRTVPASTSAYIDYLDMNTSVPNVEKTDLTISTHFGMTGVGVAMDANPYFTFKGNADTHQTGIFIWTRSVVDNGENQSTAYERYNIDVGEARFFVMKARMNIAAFEERADVICAKFSSTGADVNNVFYFPGAQAADGEWVTYVIDLETVAKEAWVKDETTGTYLVDSFWFNVCPFLTTDSMDIEYMAFVEGDWADVDALVEEDTVVSLTTHNTDAHTVVKTADGSAAE